MERHLHRIAACLIAFACFSASAAASERIRLETPVPFVEGHEIEDEIVSHCGIQEDFTSALVRELRKVADAEPAPIDDMAGRVLKVEIVDAVWGGNWFIGQDQTIRVRGALYQDGERLAGFEGIMSGRESGLPQSGCYSMKMRFRALTWYIKRWLRDPVDGARIGLQA